MDAAYDGEVDAAVGVDQIVFGRHFQTGSGIVVELPAVSTYFTVVVDVASAVEGCEGVDIGSCYFDVQKVADIYHRIGVDRKLRESFGAYSFGIYEIRNFFRRRT